MRSAQSGTDTVNEPAPLRRLPLDPLTGLAERAGFVERLSHALQETIHRGRDLAAIVVDVDGFCSASSAGCRKGQGYLFWPPLPAGELIAVLGSRGA